MSNEVNLGDWAKRSSDAEGLEMATAYKVRELSDKYVPFLSSALSTHVETNHDDAGAHIVYMEPYSHRQFVGLSPNGVPYNYTTIHHPLAQSNWIEPVKQESINLVTSFAKEAILHGKNTNT